MRRIATFLLMSSALMAQDKYLATSPGQSSCPRINEDDSTTHPGSVADAKGGYAPVQGGGTGVTAGSNYRDPAAAGAAGSSTNYQVLEAGKPHFIPMGQRPSASAFGVSDRSGKNLTVAELKGKVVVIGFWTTACDASCRQLMELADLQPKGEKFGFSVLPVNFDPERWGKVMPFIQKNAKFFEKTQIYLPGVGAQGPSVLSKVIPALPAVFIVDREGNLAFAGTGYEANALVENLKKVLVEKKPSAN